MEDELLPLLFPKSEKDDEVVVLSVVVVAAVELLLSLSSNSRCSVEQFYLYCSNGRCERLSPTDVVVVASVFDGDATATVVLVPCSDIAATIGDESGSVTRKRGGSACPCSKGQSANWSTAPRNNKRTLSQHVIEGQRGL